MADEKKAAVATAASQNSRQNYSSLAPLAALRGTGAMPKDGVIWIGLGYRPPKHNSLSIDPENLPTDDECRAVAGLDVLICINGYLTKYGALRRLCGSLYAARPKRLQLFDMDYKKFACLKIGGI